VIAVAALVWLGLFVAGCDATGFLGSLNFNIYIPLGLTGESGLFNPTGSESTFILPDTSIDVPSSIIGGLF
jgi:hypothetical protein